ncbi:MAG: thioredoxin family protein [Polyangiaceae bacterium]|jgi:thiol:disulfide interchange protein DsbD|nr:thioredoxin family protein [Polyangiaceae bacterium]
MNAHNGFPKHLASRALLLVLAASAASAFASDASDGFTAALEQGPLYAALAAFVGGLLTSLTPCVYPMIAVTVSVFGAKQAKSRGQAMLLSTAFVLGIAAMFTPMGLGAGLTGSLFGAALSSKWVVVFIALVFLAMSGSMFGLFEFVLPSKLTNKLATVGGIGYGGAFVLGLISGLVAAPCTGPVLTGILLWIGNTQNPWLGAAALFSFSLGLGVPFWLVGTFAIRLPKSGKWMVGIKSFFGIVMAVAALYFLKNAFPHVVRALPTSALVPTVAAVAALAGLGLGAVHLNFDEGRGRSIRKALGLALSITGLAIIATWLEMPKDELAEPAPDTASAAEVPGKPLAWEHDEPPAIAKAKQERKPVMVDFTADWCAACKKLARITFADPNVRLELDRYVLLKIDATDDEDPKVVDLQKKYKVVGLPTVLLLRTDNSEAKRITDFVPPHEFLPMVRDVR